MPQTTTHKLRQFILIAITMLCVNAPGVHAADNRYQLPEIGAPASQVISPGQEQQLGEVLAAQIRGAFPTIDDPELNTYIQTLGTRLLGGGVDTQINFNFMLVNDPNINAFAAPGGVIVIHTGLLTSARSESELAGVVAHEIAHIEQRHLARAYENASKINIATALAVLASVAAGVAMDNSNVTAAALYSAMGASSQAQLAFSRAHEQEADRVGIDLLMSANFDPHGMPLFFERLHKYSELNSGPVPEFLSTHPVTLSRISDTKSRAAQQSGKFVKDSTRFQFAKARAIALTANPADLIRVFEEASRNGIPQKSVDTYSYAIALDRAGEHHRAIELLDTIDQSNDAALSVNLATAQAYLNVGETTAAHKLLQRLNEIYPGDEAIVYFLSKSLIDMKRANEALKHMERLAYQKRHNPLLDKLRAEAAAATAQPWLSHEAMADYYIAHGQYGSALEQLDLALKTEQADTVTLARAQSKRRKLLKLQEPDGT